MMLLYQKSHSIRVVVKIELALLCEHSCEACFLIILIPPKVKEWKDDLSAGGKIRNVFVNHFSDVCKIAMFLAVHKVSDFNDVVRGDFDTKSMRESFLCFSKIKFVVVKVYAVSGKLMEI